MSLAFTSRYDSSMKSIFVVVYHYSINNIASEIVVAMVYYIHQRFRKFVSSLFSIHLIERFLNLTFIELEHRLFTKCKRSNESVKL